MKRNIVLLCGLIALACMTLNPPAAISDISGQGKGGAVGRTMARQATRDGSHWSTTDHSRHKALKQTFESGSQVTGACISCHSEAHRQFS